MVYFIAIFLIKISLTIFSKGSSKGSIETLTNQVIDEVGTLHLEKIKSHSAPESEESSVNFEVTPVPKKKLSLDSKDLDAASAASTLEYLKEKSQKVAQEKDMDERSDCSSVGMMKKISPSATLTSVSIVRKTLFLLVFEWFSSVFIYFNYTIKTFLKNIFKCLEQ